MEVAIAREYKKFLQAPFPYFGGKRQIADKIWELLGDVEHYLEPFCGSCAVLLKRPNGLNLPDNYAETINDKDFLIANIWRAIKYAPDETAKYADDIVCHIDMYAKNKYIYDNSGKLKKLLANNPEAYDAKIAGYSIYVLSTFIGGSIHINKEINYHTLGGIPHIVNNGTGIHASKKYKNIKEWFEILSKRLRRVRIVNGEWNRILGGNWQDGHWRTVGIYLDPPYSTDRTGRKNGLYHIDHDTIAHDVRKYCIKNGNRENFKIILSGYSGEHEELAEYGWIKINWIANGGYSNRNKDKSNNNRFKEVLWINPTIVKENNNSTIFNIGEKICN